MYATKVYQGSWWMIHYGGSSPKRHIMFSNSPAVSKLCKGRLQGWKAHMNKESKPCRSYKGKDGRRRFHGTKNLKSTEKLISWKEIGILWFGRLVVESGTYIPTKWNNIDGTNWMVDRNNHLYSICFICSILTSILYLILLIYQPQLSWNRIPNRVTSNCVEQFFRCVCVCILFVWNENWL